MTNSKPRLRKREIDTVLDQGNTVLHNMYVQARSHMQIDIPVEQLISAVVEPNDVPVIMRSGQLFDYVVRSDYIAYPNLLVGKFPGVQENYLVQLVFTNNLGVLVPSYLEKVSSADKLPEQFVPTFMPVVEQLVELRKLYNSSAQAWHKLRGITGKSLPRMRAMWPAVDTIAKKLGVDLSALPKPSGCPAADPELREAIINGTAFINSVMLMPPMQGTPRKFYVDVVCE